MKTMIAIAAAAGLAAAANADIQINEIQGSTPGADGEFVELKNTSGASVDLTGWTLELWDSDDNSGFGGSDGFGTYAMSGSVAAGGYFTIANAIAEATYGFTADNTFADNSVENGAYTLVLRDAGANIIETLFVTDGTDMGANISGAAIAADNTVGPDGTFLPGGAYRVSDGSAWAIMDFGLPAALATPGAMNVPTPASMALLGLGGLAATRRRRG